MSTRKMASKVAAAPRRTAIAAPRKASPPTGGVSAAMGRRIRAAVRTNPGRIFAPFDFLDLGSPHAVGMALTRMARSGQLRRLGRGLYDVPRVHPSLGELSPTADEIAAAVARRDGAKAQPAGAMAANLLSLSEQVPMRPVYFTDGPSRIVKVGSQTIQLRRRPARQMRNGSPMSNLVFAALRSLGKAHVTSARISHLRTTLSAAHRRRLLKDLPLAPAWMHPHLRFIAGQR